MNAAALPWLFVLIPLATAVAALGVPAARVRLTVILGGVLTAAAGIAIAGHVLGAHSAGMSLESWTPVVPSLGLVAHLGADGLSAGMAALCGIIQTIAAIASPMDRRPRAYAVLLSLLAAGTNLVFVGLDWMSFYIGWELMLIPMYILIALWGGDQRRYAAIKYVLFTLIGSLALLFVIVLLPARIPDNGVLAEVSKEEAAAGRVTTPAIAYPPACLARKDVGTALDGTSGAVLCLHGLPVLIGRDGGYAVARSADLTGRAYVLVPRSLDIAHHQLLWKYWDGQRLLGVSVAWLGFILVLVAFAVKVPVIGLHTWLPHAHVQAPTAISVILAALLLKLGVYGMLRIAWPVFPTAALDAGLGIALLGAIAVLYAGWVALMQGDLKRLVAYSSVSHMGWCLLGIAAGTAAGLSGAVIQMLTHGLGSAMLFLMVGVLYDRAHHRRIDGFGGLMKPMPVFTGIALLACLASAGLPGLAGFVGEVLVALGAVQSDAAGGAVRLAGLAACLGVVITAAYLLWMVRRVFFGPLRHAEQATWPDLTRRELACLVPLAVLTILFGVWPQPMLDLAGPWAESFARHLAWVGAVR
jgi:NADH-quinone oxidoreductase subunit M